MGRFNDELHAKVGAACTAAGKADEGWNTRFRAALEASGVRLIEERDHVTAPYPYGFTDAWSKGSILVLEDARPPERKTESYWQRMTALARGLVG